MPTKTYINIAHLMFQKRVRFLNSVRTAHDIMKIQKTMSSPNIPVIEVGHVRLILLHDENPSFHLDIPLDTIRSLCSKPLKYLRFLGWCILGVDGVLAYEPDGDEVDTDGNLSEHEIYYCNAEDEGTFSLTIPLLLYAQTSVL